MIVRAGRTIWLNPFSTVLFTVCSSVTVECCVLYPCCVGVFCIFVAMYGRRLFSMSLLGFVMGTMFANLHMCGVMLVL